MDAHNSCPHCSPEFTGEGASTRFFVLALSLLLFFGGLVAMGVIPFDGVVELLRR